MRTGEIFKLEFSKDELKADLSPVSYGHAHSVMSPHKRSSEYSLYISYVWYNFLLLVAVILTSTGIMINVLCCASRRGKLLL